MEALIKALEGAGPYLAVFILGAAVVTWLLKDRARILVALDSSNERLLEEREKRAHESLETAKLLAESTQKITDHNKSLEKVLDRWPTLSSL